MANITHIFWEDKTALQLEEVKYQAFYRCDELKYLEMPTNKDIMIASYAFNRCEKFFENIEQEYADAFFKNITIIQGSAFLKNSFENVVINLSEKLTWLGN